MALNVSFGRGGGGCSLSLLKSPLTCAFVCVDGSGVASPNTFGISPKRGATGLFNSGFANGLA